jgi:hypothetical protein
VAVVEADDDFGAGTFESRRVGLPDGGATADGNLQKLMSELDRIGIGGPGERIAPVRAISKRRSRDG